jgi:trans-2,3-dihydro-3-hydroxyanthranilate isomerase
MRRLAFSTIDVFTSEPLKGNPLAVLPEAGELADAEMLAIAREFSLPETTFVTRRDKGVERERGIRTRIFSTKREMPFAGHPTLGTAAVLSDLEGVPDVALELNVGTVPVHFSQRDGRPFGEMTQIEPTFGQLHDRHLVAHALDVSPDEIDDNPPIQTVTTGNPIAIVRFRRLAALQNWTPDWNRLERYLRGTDAQFFYAVCTETVAPDAQLHARMPFWIGDDPATGSAAGPAAAWMVRYGLAASGSAVEIEQGLEVLRPSRITARADLSAGRVGNVRVGGHFVPVTRGELQLPT